MTDAGTLELADILADYEFALSCERDECPNSADWEGVFIPCRQTRILCSGHRAQVDADVESESVNAFCINCKETIDAVEWSPCGGAH